MKKSIFTLAVIIALMTSIDKKAFAWGWLSGDELYEDLTSSNPVDFALAMRYIIGVVDSYNSINKTQITTPARPVDLMNAVRKYYAENPEKKKYAAGEQVMKAILNNFEIEKR